jgi:hypothetical protein
MLPKLEDRLAGVGGAGIDVGCAGDAGTVRGVEEAGGVVAEPAGEGVIGTGSPELGQDALAKLGDRVSEW